VPAAIFNGTAVKVLKNTLRFKDGTDLTSTELVTTTNTAVLTNKTLTNPLITTNGTINLTAAGTLGIATNAGANNITIGGSSSTLVIPGNLQVDGTTTTVNSTTMDVADSNISVNVGGNQASADSNDAGLTVEMSDATNAIIHYDSTLASKWTVGEVGSTSEIITAGNTQTLINKTLTSPTIATIVNTGTLTLPTDTDTLVGRATTDTLTNKTVVVANNTITTAASGNLTSTELNAALAELQTDIDTRASVTDIYNTTNSSGTFTAVSNTTHLVDTSGGGATVTLPAASANTFVRIKDKGSANSNNIVVNTPGAETVDGAASDTINSNFGAVVYVCDGTNWFKL
jgi:hypothetical protein